MIHYEVWLKDQTTPMPVDAEQVTCSERGYVIFLSRPAPGEKFQEVQRFKSSNVVRVDEPPAKPKPKSKTVQKMDKEMR